MDSLPSEILVDICSYLCFHCRNPGHFPHADTDEVRDEKRALAHLCRTSKALAAVAYPFLYHYYATGNLNHARSLGGNRSFVDNILDGYNNDRTVPDRLPQFLRTIIVDSPDLASHVVSMQIVYHRQVKHYDNLEAIFHALAGRNLLPAEWDAAQPWPSILRSEDVHKWLWTLAVRHCPRLQSLLISYEPAKHYRELEMISWPPFNLPSLKMLGILISSWRYPETSNWPEFVAPNLETLHVGGEGDCLGTGDIIQFNATTFPINLTTRLKGLSFANLNQFTFLGSMLETTPGLEHLEFYWPRQAVPDLALSSLLLPVKRSLRSLRYICMLRDFNNAPAIYDGPDEVPVTDEEGSFVIPGEGLKSFGMLEHLSLDCRSIYRPEDEDVSDRLVSFLPPSIRTLHIPYLYRSMENSLRQVALEAPTEFPLLENVELGISVTPEADLTAMQTLGSLFAAAGIVLSCSADVLWPNALATMFGSPLIQSLEDCSGRGGEMNRGPILPPF